ncbi:MAG: hypothetical protein ABFD92_16660 [Planctomycetaceae bacterium]|nr:hypothetical protein [Planctomycetaceae bacterium]
MASDNTHDKDAGIPGVIDMAAALANAKPVKNLFPGDVQEMMDAAAADKASGGGIPFGDGASAIPFDDVMAGPPALPAVLLDRSTLERYAVCPLSAWAIETGAVEDASRAAASGDECHGVLSGAVGLYADQGIAVYDYIRQEMLKVRPDLQEDVMDGLKRSAWKISEYLSARSPADLVAFDGGAGPRSGQLAAELLPANDSRGPIVATSELDLLVAGATAAEMEETDWKSGHTPWSSAMVRDSFQFRMHAWLAFKNFPDLQQLHVRVFMTRVGYATPWVTFERDMMEAFEARMLMAVRFREDAFILAADGRSEEIPCWHDAEELMECPAVHLSRRVKHPAADLLEDPGRFASDTMAMAKALDDRKKLMRQYVMTHGDIVDAATGIAFGLDRPREPKKPTAAEYQFYKPTGDQAPELKDELAAVMMGPDAKEG